MAEAAVGEDPAVMYLDFHTARITGEQDYFNLGPRAPNRYSYPELAVAWLCGFFNAAFDDAYFARDRALWVH